MVRGCVVVARAKGLDDWCLPRTYTHVLDDRRTMKTYDVYVVYANGSEETFPKVHYVTLEQGMILRLDVKKYTALPHDETRVHVASLSVFNLRRWQVTEVDPA
jgi:hypothetical protein